MVCRMSQIRVPPEAALFFSGKEVLSLGLVALHCLVSVTDLCIAHNSCSFNSTPPRETTFRSTAWMKSKACTVIVEGHTCRSFSLKRGGLGTWEGY